MDKVVSEAAEPTLARTVEDEKRASEEVGRLLRYLAAHLFDVGFGAEDVKLAFGPEADDLIATFAAELGIRLDDYIAEAQLEVALRLLLGSDLTLTRISENLGYYSPATFTNTVDRYFGLQPGKLRGLLRSAAASQRIASATPPDSPLPRIERARVTRRLAEGFWEILARLPFPDGLAFLRRNAFFGGEDLLELLSRRSREDGRRQCGRGVELAELALVTIEGSAPLLADRYADLHALALARLGNSRRIAGDLKGADEAFRHIEGMWDLPEGVSDRHVVAEILHLEASLRLFERRFDETRHLLERTLGIARELGDVPLQVSAMLQRASVNYCQDRPRSMFPDLTEVQQLFESQAQPDRLLLLGFYQQRTLAQLGTGHLAEARKDLSRAQTLCEELDHVRSRRQLLWSEGRLAINDGEEARAERLFRQALTGFRETGDRDCAALVALELAILCHPQGRIEEVMELVTRAVIPAFGGLRLTGEALADLKLLQEAGAGEAVSIAVLHKTQEMLLQLRRDPT